jgi:DNA/RNA endonuclease G (NUC1)
MIRFTPRSAVSCAPACARGRRGGFGWAVWVVAAGLLMVGGRLTAETRVVESRPGNAVNWTATQWTADEVARFGGRPTVRGEESRVLLLARYSYFVSNYDVARRYPVWVAHVDRADSILKYAGRKKGAWGRGDDVFLPDAQVVEQAGRRKLPFATAESFTNANPPELPEGEKGAGKITRGHLASNAEMKSLGEPEQGLRSQAESFSLANVVPQMQRNNAPIWSKLEDDCINWAAIMGGVSVISGPVYWLDPTQPPPINRLVYTTGRDGTGMPIPTHFFKVVIGRIDGRPAAVGFLVPHRADLTMDELKDCVVPIRRIEEMTGIDFMPKFGANDVLETRKDERWLELLVRGRH